jgi:hypothetical protein
MSMKNSNDTIGNRTRDLPACSAVPQPTAPRFLQVPGYTTFFLLLDELPLSRETPLKVSTNNKFVTSCAVFGAALINKVHHVTSDKPFAPLFSLTSAQDKSPAAASLLNCLLLTHHQ